MGRAILPNLSHRNLREMLGKRPSIRLGFQTYAETVHGSSDVRIRHYQSTIATVSADGVHLDACHDSITTAHRLNAVLVDNGFAPYGVAIRNREIALVHKGTVHTPSLHWIDARRDAETGAETVTAGM